MNAIIHFRLNGLILAAIIAFGLTLVTGCNKDSKTTSQEAIVEIPDDSVYIKRGNQIVAITFDTLRNSLLHAISTQGMEGAIEFCNERAYPLTTLYADSFAIRRTAFRVRNSSNQPDSLELVVLTEMNEIMNQSQSPSVKVVRQSKSDEIHFFKPIILQPMCLSCHGTPGAQIQASTLSQIQKFYPADQAVNFKEGDLRGLWHIIFKAKE
jgi:hypothetical protein